MLLFPVLSSPVCSEVSADFVRKIKHLSFESSHNSYLVFVLHVKL